MLRHRPSDQGRRQRELAAVKIPYEGRTLPGYFMQPNDSGIKRPTIMIITCGDGTAERLYCNGGGAAGLRRGYNVLCFEGPGQSGAYRLDPSLTYRYDWEVPTTAAVDYLISRPEVDADRIGYIGYSWGGYFVPRAAAFEKRIAACVAACLLPDVYTPVVQTMGVQELIESGQRFVLTTEDEGAELHTVRGNSSLLHQIEFDWLDEVLASSSKPLHAS
jgi:dipeptidyl aminopeptidase/acylaminoacyl peptidase